MTKKIKIAQISDIHWRGSSRHEEYTKAFEKLFDLLRADKPDMILCTGDIFHTKTQGISPEVVERMVWMFQELGKIAPMRTILGNHDGNLANNSRQDAITPIFKALNDSSQMRLFKESGCFEDDLFPDINWCVFSCFDKEGWSKCAPNPDKINVALFHGSIIGCQTDGGFRMNGGEETINTFNEYDYVLMGDIHKMQFMSERKSDDGTDKPWIGYPGSLIQQNFGEEEVKGYLVWELEGKNAWNVNFVEVPNFCPYVTTSWQGDLEKTKEFISKTRNNIFLSGSRYRVLSRQNISDVEVRQLTEWLTDKGVDEVVVKFDIETNLDNIQTDSIQIQKTSLRNNPDVLVKLYSEYLINNQSAHPLDEKQQESGNLAIHDYLVKLKNSEPDVIARDVSWSLKSLDFDNIFKYGEGNSIDFTKLSGIVGIFGPNRAGKSSIPGTLMYTLFNATDRGPMKTGYVINKHKNEARGRAHVNINGTDYVIERTSQRDEPKRRRKKEIDTEKTSTSLTVTKVLANGTTVPITGTSRDETDKDLRRLIGTSEDFLMTSFASQGAMNKFIEEGATERKVILSKFLDLDIFKKLCDFAKDDCSLLNGKTKRYSDVQWEQLIDDTKKEISQLEATKLVIESRILEKRKEVDETKVWVLQKEKEFDINSIYQLEAELQAKETQLEKAQKNFNELGALLKVKQSSLLVTEMALKEIDIQSFLEKQEKFEGIRNLFAEIESSFKVEQTTLEHQEKSIKKLEVVPCGDQFPQCHFIRDSHEAKGKIEEQRRLVAELQQKYNDAKVDIKTFVDSKISDTIKKHRELMDTKGSLESALRELKTKQGTIDVIRLVTERNKIKEQIDKVKETLDDSVESNIQEKKEHLYTLGRELESLEVQKNECLLSLGSKKQRYEQSLLEKEECQDILSKLQVYESVYKAFSKNGIPAMILKSQLPAINHELDKILSNVIDFKISLETDTSSNSMDVFIEDKDGKRIIEVASGMEKMITSIALRVALTNLSSLPRSDLFILDEGFGALDDVSLNQCLMLMSMLKTYFRVILIITHIAPIKEIADTIIEITSDGSHSFIQV